jgi:hypothetical protein
MPKTQKSGLDPDKHISDPEDMAEEAAQRLWTVLTLLNAEVNDQSGEDGGYSLYTAIDLITRIPSGPARGILGRSPCSWQLGTACRGRQTDRLIRRGKGAATASRGASRRRTAHRGKVESSTDTP